MLQIAFEPPSSPIFPVHARNLMNSQRIVPKDALPSHPPISRVQVPANLSSLTSPSLSIASFKSPTVPVPLPVNFPPKADPSCPVSPVSSVSVDVLSQGDFVGEGGFLQGEQIRRVSCSLTAAQPASEFQVVRSLGTGSYAVVYLVREVLYRSPPSEDGHGSLMGLMDFGSRASIPAIEYGAKYAIKCLSKANLDADALSAQMAEVTIHQSLCSHPNIVTLHRTLETDSYLLLVLEFVPGEDLFYFLEQARDHYDSESNPPTPDNHASTSSSYTPPTPSLLSALNSTQLLSRNRLRLISSMFSQMCEAVAACHVQQVFHRDIKPENFIVTDGWSVTSDGSHERKVIVKLSDFGLSTTDIESSDMDCGSAPYMSYECRNNTAPSYRPRGADVWSLGIVLINMLYHNNPWSDTTKCPSFDLYCQQPVQFFMERFAGMTVPVAEYLATKIFCLLDDPTDDSPRASASEFGAWVRDLPALLGTPSGSRYKHVASSGSIQGHPISHVVLQSHRPSSRQASANSGQRPPAAVNSRPTSRSRAPSHGPVGYDLEASELSTVYDHEQEEQEERYREVGIELEAMRMDIDDTHSRSTSANKRRKRGIRRGKGSTPSPAPTDEVLASLADKSQSLARQISRASHASVGRSSAHRPPEEPMPMYHHPSSVLSAPSISKPATPTITKKTSKWKLSWRSAGERVVPPEDISLAPESPPATTAAKNVTNVSNIIMSLNAPPPSTAPRTDEVIRGRRRKQSLGHPDGEVRMPRGRSAGYALSDSRTSPDWSTRRPVSPTSTRSGRPLASSASSSTSGNWRNSMSTTSSAGTSTSAFTRFSNSSMYSVSTTATSVSSSSWRSRGKTPAVPSIPPNVPKNIKFMTGMPWELDEPPRQLLPNPGGHVFNSPPVRKQRMRKPKDGALDTITERPGTSGHRAPVSQRRDAMTSTTDLGVSGWKDDFDSPKKVQMGQKHTLAKLLFRR